jgi:hypothetical protein
MTAVRTPGYIGYNKILVTALIVNAAAATALFFLAYLFFVYNETALKAHLSTSLSVYPSACVCNGDIRTVSLPHIQHHGAPIGQITCLLVSDETKTPGSTAAHHSLSSCGDSVMRHCLLNLGTSSSCVSRFTPGERIHLAYWLGSWTL